MSDPVFVALSDLRVEVCELTGAVERVAKAVENVLFENGKRNELLERIADELKRSRMAHETLAREARTRP